MRDISPAVNDGWHLTAPRRPSDALAQALVNGASDNRWQGGRLGSLEVKTLIALRELGWDIVRRPSATKPSGRSTPDRRLAEKVYSAWRNARRRAARWGCSPNDLSKSEAREILQAAKCHWCGESVELRQRSIDHVRPLRLGGGNTMSNVVMSCRTCNNLKFLNERPCWGAGLDGCVECGRSDDRHVTGGLCPSCYGRTQGWQRGDRFVNDASRQRAASAAELTLYGLAPREVADALGVSAGHVRRSVKKWVAVTGREVAGVS